MYKSCKYCGKIHDSKFDCGHKPKYKKKYNDKENFRGTTQWKKKREDIKTQDKYVCVVCLYLEKQVTINNLSVHHIVSLEEDYDLRLEDDNLITVCEYHHEQAEKKQISKEILRKLIQKHRKNT